MFPHLKCVTTADLADALISLVDLDLDSIRAARAIAFARAPCLSPRRHWCPAATANWLAIGILYELWISGAVHFFSTFGFTGRSSQYMQFVSSHSGVSHFSHCGQ